MLKTAEQEVHYVYYNVKEKRYYELVLKPYTANFMHLCKVNYGKRLEETTFVMGKRLIVSLLMVQEKRRWNHLSKEKFSVILRCIGEADTTPQ